MNKRSRFLNRWLSILCLSASLLPVCPNALTAAYSPFSIHPASRILHPFPVIQQQPVRKINPEALKKYVGRYQLEPGIIPISTLDVTLENDELWVKPSVVKKRRLHHKSKTVFIDEIEGTPLTFNKDDE